MRFSISLPLWLSAYLLSFPRYNHLLVENLHFSPRRFTNHSLVWSPRWTVPLRLSVRKLVSKATVPRMWKLHDPTVVSFESILACDGQPNGQTDTPHVAKSRCSIAERDKTRIRGLIATLRLSSGKHFRSWSLETVTRTDNNKIVDSCC